MKIRVILYGWKTANRIEGGFFFSIIGTNEPRIRLSTITFPRYPTSIDELGLF